MMIFNFVSFSLKKRQSKEKHNKKSRSEDAPGFCIFRM